jgi:hypothetical protein
VKAVRDARRGVMALRAASSADPEIGKMHVATKDLQRLLLQDLFYVS